MKLIDADALKKLLTLNNKTMQNIIYAVIDSCETSGAVPTVKCRQCKYVYCNGWELHCLKQLDSNTGAPIVYADDFCSRGKRKDGAE